jgi:hypothetical protein
MYTKHLLGLDIPDTNNPYIFKVKDSSLYADSLLNTCNRLWITVPGFNEPVEIDVQPGFDKQLTACDLGMQLANCGVDFNVIPDGIYVIRYSVAPNEYVFVEYNYLRMTGINNSYYNQLSKLELALSDPDSDMLDILKELRLIRTFLDAAKAKVESDHEPVEGVNMLAYAKKRFNKLMETCL